MKRILIGILLLPILPVLALGCLIYLLGDLMIELVENAQL